MFQKKNLIVTIVIMFWSLDMTIGLVSKTVFTQEKCYIGIYGYITIKDSSDKYTFHLSDIKTLNLKKSFIKNGVSRAALPPVKVTL